MKVLAVLLVAVVAFATGVDGADNDRQGRLVPHPVDLDAVAGRIPGVHQPVPSFVEYFSVDWASKEGKVEYKAAGAEPVVLDHTKGTEAVKLNGKTALKKDTGKMTLLQTAKRRFVIPTPRSLVEMNADDTPKIMFFEEVLPAAAPEHNVEVYMVAARELLDQYQYWTTVVVAGERTDEFPKVTDWRVFEKAMRPAVEALSNMMLAGAKRERDVANSGIFVDARVKRGESAAGMMEAMARSIIDTFERVSYWHEMMAKWEIGKATTTGAEPDVGIIFDSPDMMAIRKEMESETPERIPISGENGEGAEEKEEEVDENDGALLEEASDEPRGPFYGRAFVEALNAETLGDKYGKKLREAVNKQAASYVNKIYAEIDRRDKAIKDAYEGDLEMRWFKSDEELRLEMFEKELQKAKLDEVIGGTIVDGMMSTPWLRKSLLAVEYTAVEGEARGKEYVSAAEDKLKGWVKSVGAWAKDVIHGDSEKIERVNAEVEKSGGLQPGDELMAKNAYRAANRQRTDTLKERGKAVMSEQPAEAKAEKESWSKTYKFKIKPKWKLSPQLLDKVTITNDLTFTKGNVKHHFDIDLEISDPFESSKTGVKASVHYKGSSASGLSWGGGVDVMVSSVAKTSARTVEVLVSGFVTYKKGAHNTGVFASFKVPVERTADGGFRQEGVFKAHAYYVGKFNDGRTMLSAKADVLSYERPGRDLTWTATASLNHKYSDNVRLDLTARAYSDNDARFIRAEAGVNFITGRNSNVRLAVGYEDKHYRSGDRAGTDLSGAMAKLEWKWRF